MAEPDDDFGAGVVRAETLIDSAWWDEEPEQRHTVPTDATPADDPETIAHLLAEDARLKQQIVQIKALLGETERERDQVRDALTALVGHDQSASLPDGQVVRWIKTEKKGYEVKGYTVAPVTYWQLKVGYE